MSSRLTSKSPRNWLDVASLVATNPFYFIDIPEVKWRRRGSNPDRLPVLSSGVVGNLLVFAALDMTPVFTLFCRRSHIPARFDCYLFYGPNRKCLRTFRDRIARAMARIHTPSSAIFHPSDTARCYAIQSSSSFCVSMVRWGNTLARSDFMATRLDRRMARTQAARAFQQGTEAQDRRLIQPAGDELKIDRQLLGADRKRYR